MLWYYEIWYVEVTSLSWQLRTYY